MFVCSVQIHVSVECQIILISWGFSCVESIPQYYSKVSLGSKHTHRSILEHYILCHSGNHLHLCDYKFPIILHIDQFTIQCFSVVHERSCRWIEQCPWRVKCFQWRGYPIYIPWYRMLSCRCQRVSNYKYYYWISSENWRSNVDDCEERTSKGATQNNCHTK